MTVKVTIPNTFATATTAIPLSQLDANFSNVNAAINNALTFSNYAADTGTANNYAITISGQTTTYAAGIAFQFKAANTNTGASTLNVNGQGTQSIVRTDGSALSAGDIIAGGLVSVMYDGTNFQLLNDAGGKAETFTNVTITGTATINVANVTTFNPTITNAQLANSAITIGNTAVSLGGTITTINNATLVNANVSSGTVSVSSITDSGNLTFTGTGNRITGDFSNATVANRVMFQSSTTNGSTYAAFMPNGTSVVSGTEIYNSSDPANASWGRSVINGTEYRFQSSYSGTGTYLPMTFYTGGGERMRIDTSGRVGIGLTPTASVGTLQISGTAFASSQLYVGEAASTSFSGGIQNLSNTSRSVSIQSDPTNAGANSILTFGVDGTERMRIDSSGNVGIGASSPTGKLDVYTAGGTTAYFRDATVQSYYGSNTANGFSGTGTNHPFVFLTNNTERMRITSDGEVYIAGTTDQGAYNLQCNGTGVWGAGAYVNGSDARIKEDVAPIDSGLDVVEKLNPVTYRYKEDWSKDQSTQTGFIAQELLTALDGKNYVDGIVQQGGAEGYYSVAYQNIIPILTKAIQELNAKVEAQAAEIAQLKGN